MITITDAAQKQVQKLVSENELGEAFLRMGVRGGGCSGLSYTLGFDETTSEFDKVFQLGSEQEIKVVIDMKSYLYLKGTELDYTSDLLGGGFKFNNPNARKSCGCGSSFQV